MNLAQVCFSFMWTRSSKAKWKLKIFMKFDGWNESVFWNESIDKFIFSLHFYNETLHFWCTTWRNKNESRSRLMGNVKIIMNGPLFFQLLVYAVFIAMNLLQVEEVNQWKRDLRWSHRKSGIFFYHFSLHEHFDQAFNWLPKMYLNNLKN